MVYLNKIKGSDVVQRDRITFRHIVLAGVIALIGASIMMPAVYAVSDTKNTVINASVGAVISMTTSSTVNLSITPTGSGSATSASDTVTVSTNNTLGYTLQLSDSDTTNTLVNGANTIAATTGTFAAPAAMLINRWGFRVDNAGTFGAGPTSAQTNAASLSGTWAAVPISSSPAQIKSTSSTATNDVTTVWYGAFVNSAMPNGTYTGTITYTATTK